MSERPNITVHAEAAEAIREAAWNALPRETGGILIGWREGASARDVTVVAALVVSDPAAAHASYRLNQAAAQALLDDYLTRESDTNLGYVGEWHSHPEPQPPSPQDLRSLRSAARLTRRPLALLIPALDPVTDRLVWHVRVGERASRLPLARVHTATLREHE